MVPGNFATAAELVVHRNNVLYRIQRIQKLTGLDLQNPLDQNRGL
jgi:DNA-binding PucR family transcriptional regulator